MVHKANMRQYTKDAVCGRMVEHGRQNVNTWELHMLLFRKSDFDEIRHQISSWQDKKFAKELREVDDINYCRNRGV